MVKLLLEADPNAIARDGGDALFQSVMVGCDPVAMSLASDDRVDVNYTNSDGYTALFLAARKRNHRVFARLISRPDIVVSFRTKSGATLLHAVARDTAMATAVIARGGIDVNGRDKYGETALHKAAFAGNIEVVKLLLAQPGIDVNVVTKCGGTALHHAIGGRQTAVAELLIGQPTMDVNWRSANCAAPINLTIHGNMIGVVRALCAREDLDVSGDIGVRNGFPPLVVAAYCGCVEAISLLLGHQRMCLENESCGVEAALAMAMKMGFVEFVRLIKAKRGMVRQQQPGKAKRVRRRRKKSNAV
jgi:cytohesin